MVLRKVKQKQISFGCMFLLPVISIATVLPAMPDNFQTVIPTLASEFIRHLPPIRCRTCYLKNYLPSRLLFPMPITGTKWTSS